MKQVTFTKPWRGYAAGDEAELTDERAAELEAAGYFAKPKKTTKKANASNSAKNTSEEPKQ